ncbi:RING-H2 finger protein ATL51-like [Rhodamnia argentea]|uniref:RING-type E3 ubiquitin transferase n=1 Tax=Rhodamnia argentea TaxID=178133 RepID=A0A8B8PS78_9MYRT|nr:RING-H2 finger protein ATL51-like [Rhodamnia argentea]
MTSGSGPISPVATPDGGDTRHWNPLVISLFAFVCTVFLLFSSYSILKRFLRAFRLTTFSRNRALRPQLLNDANPDNPSLQFHSHGLDSFTMRNLPTTQLRKKEAEAMKPSISTECAVCLTEFEEGDWLKHLPYCAHSFHVACIDTWFQLHSNCPLCRAQVACHLNVQIGSVVSARSLMGTLEREDFVNERTSQSHHQSLRSQILENSAMARDELVNPTPENE